MQSDRCVALSAGCVIQYTPKALQRCCQATSDRRMMFSSSSCCCYDYALHVLPARPSVFGLNPDCDFKACNSTLAVLCLADSKCSSPPSPRRRRQRTQTYAFFYSSVRLSGSVRMRLCSMASVTRKALLLPQIACSLYRCVAAACVLQLLSKTGNNVLRENAKYGMGLFSDQISSHLPSKVYGTTTTNLVRSGRARWLYGK